MVTFKKMDSSSSYSHHLEFYLVQINTTLIWEISCSNWTVKLNVEVILKQDVTSLHNRKCVCVWEGAHTVELRGVVQGLTIT